MDALSRRSMLALAATGSLAAGTSARAAEFGNPDRPPQGAVNARPGALSDPGPQSPPLAAQFPATQNPPATDVGDMQTFWSSFNTAHRRIQSGGWARQVTQADFPISTAVSGVNMRLSAGGIREMHWHLAAEWAYMTAGRCRITYLDAEGHASVQDVAKGDLWYFPAGMPHSLQGLGPDGCEFLIVFDDGSQSEFGTLLVTDWLAHTPPDDLALNFGLPAEAFQSIPLDDLWIFQGREPGPLATDQTHIASAGTPPEPVTFSLEHTVPVRENRSGRLQMADSRTFKASKTIAAAIEVIKPGAMREMHWHPNADEWQYYVQGEGRMTVFGAGPRAQTADFRAGDLGYVKKSNGHYVKNTGTTDLIFLAVFKTAQYQEISLSDWLTHTPPELVAQHLTIAPSVLARMSKDRPGLVPA